MNNIPYGKQHITEADLEAVREALQADFLTQGPRIDAFEKAFAAYTGSRYAVALANGTAALHLCTLALGVNEQSKVLCTPITFAASSNCVRYAGGNVDFVDIDPETWLMDLKAAREKLEAAPKGTYQGMIPVDFAGRAVNLEEARKLADEYGLWIIEDACHAPGGYFVDGAGQKQHCGNGQYADLAIFSFHPVKHIACGEGGMITTNDEQLYKKLLQLRTHGITRQADEFMLDPHFASSGDYSDYPAWYMEMQVLGYNYRLTDFQAALGLSQLSRADDGLERRRAIAGRYARELEAVKAIKRQAGLVEGHAYHLYVLEVENRRALFEFLRTKGIYCQIHYIPTHVMPYYQSLGWKSGDLPQAEHYYTGCISLPMYPTLSDDEQAFVIEQIKTFYA